MKTVAGSLCFLLLALLCFEAAGADKEQDKKKRPYASAAADCDKAISGKKSELAESYSSEVWSLKQRFQRDGDLEKALAADKEWSRSIRREPLTPEDLVESPKELRTLQDAYVDRQEQVEQQVAADVVRDLEREAKELAQAGNLTDGRVLQREIDKIKRLYLSDKAANANSSSTAKSKAADKTSLEDPVAACEEMIRQKRVSLQAQYVGELEAMEKSFQSKGELENLFATKAERQRFIEAPLLTESNIVAQPEPLQELQQRHLELQLNLTQSTAEEFIAKLDQQKQSLTVEGKLDGAVSAKTAADKLRMRYVSGPDASPDFGRVLEYREGDWVGTCTQQRGNKTTYDCNKRHRLSNEYATFTGTLVLSQGKVVKWLERNYLCDGSRRGLDRDLPATLMPDGKTVSFGNEWFIRGKKSVNMRVSRPAGGLR